MIKITIDELYCKGCGLCIHSCKKKIFHESNDMNAKGYAIPNIVSPENCTNCKVCEKICPECVVSIEENSK